MQNHKLKNLKETTEKSISGSVYKPFQIVQPPSVISQICQSSEINYEKMAKKAQFQLEHLIKINRGSHIKRINQKRQTYRKIKQKIAKRFQKFSQDIENLSLGEVLVWKQEILTEFLGEFLSELSLECKQKSEILLFVWNTIFTIIEYLIQLNGKLRHRDQKEYLNDLLQNHKKYQSVIESLKAKIAKKEESFIQQQEFISALVYNLRYKRKEIKKLSNNLKLCTVRLNQFKDIYLDLQIQHIELLSQNRDITKENALNLIKRKQEINYEKRKEYRLKPSHKKLRFQIQNQIEHENLHQSENVDKLNQELKVTFDNYYRKKNKAKSKVSNMEECTQNIFDNALDEFNVRIESVPQTQNLIDYKSKIGFIDAETDMNDFQRDVEDVATEITQYDKLYEDMISHAMVQTQQIKSKPKQFQEEGIQVDINELKNTKMNRVKVIDRSYILSDYRDKRYKNEKGIPSLWASDGLTRQNQLSLSKLSVEELNRSKNKSGVDEKVQTDNQPIFDMKDIPNEVRDSRLEKEISNYFKKLNNFRSNQDKIILNWGSSPEKRTTLDQTNSFKSSRPSFSRFVDESTEISTARSTSRKHRFKKGVSSSTHFFNSRKSSNLKREERESQSQVKINLTKTYINHEFEEIKENKYENMVSGENRQPTQRSLLSHSEKVRKFWVMKPMTDPVSQRKQRFLNDLNTGDHLLSKRPLYKSDHFQENKKMLMQLQKLSQQLQNHQSHLQLIEQNVNQNMIIIREQLKKMLNKKKNNRILPISRQQSLCRIISFVYTYAYHLYFNHKKEIQSMIIPLFHYFKIGYGEIKKNDLYLRMLYFLSQTICHQNQNYIFENFILFLGLKINTDNNLRIGKQITCLHLRLLHKLSVNFRFPIEVEELYTTVHCLDTKCKQILMEENLEENIVNLIIEKVKGKLNGLANQWEANQEERVSDDFSETKLNVFKCCELIIQEIQRIKRTLQNSYIDLLQYFTIFKESQHQQFTNYILYNFYIPKIEFDSKQQKMKQHLEKLQKIQRPQRKFEVLVRSILEVNIPEFSKLYYFALSKFKIKEEFLYLSLNRRLKFLMNYIKRHESSFFIEQTLINSIINQEDKTLVKEDTSKKIMALAYLKTIENQSQQLLSKILGYELFDLYTISSKIHLN